MTISAGTKLDEIFAELFGTEDALVRVQFVNGTMPSPAPSLAR